MLYHIEMNESGIIYNELKKIDFLSSFHYLLRYTE